MGMMGVVGAGCCCDGVPPVAVLHYSVVVAKLF